MVKFQLNFEITACDSYGIRGKPKTIGLSDVQIERAQEPNKYAVSQNTQVHQAG